MGDRWMGQSETQQREVFKGVSKPFLQFVVFAHEERLATAQRATEWAWLPAIRLKQHSPVRLEQPQWPEELPASLACPIARKGESRWRADSGHVPAARLRHAARLRAGSAANSGRAR